jgi:hypothetical protein
MKKIFTLAAGLSLTIGLMAQTQRLSLTEEFTNASCGPCAGQNPAFNALIDANSTKMIALKYQVNFPGVDPMNAQNPTEVNTRRTYYGVNGVPFANLNGDTSALTAPNYTGAPANFNQDIIDSAYAVPSPFGINISHTLSSDIDSIFITCTINASQAINLPALSLRMAITERAIVFSTAPGTNGETEFFDVMRKMVPNATGVSLPAAWTQGQDTTFTYALALPTYIYNPTQIAVVAFIQENVNKTVQQAGISLPVAIANYAAITGATFSQNIVTCNTSVSPTITLKNEGSAPLTSATVSYTIDGGAAQTAPFTGNVAPGGVTTFSIPTLNSLNPGQRNVVYRLLNLNGSTTNSAAFNQSLYIVGTPQAGNAFTESFGTATFPYANWLNINDDTPGFTRSTTAGFGSPKGALKMDFYNSTEGKVDRVILPPFSFNNFLDATLSFKVAAKGYPFSDGSQTDDTLIVKYSSDCGATWSQAWLKNGVDLSTVAAATASYTATADADYRDESVVLAGTANKSQILIMFEARSNYGNNAYIDNINISASQVGINEIAEDLISAMYPNPANNLVSLVMNNSSNQSRLDIFDAVGKSIYTQNITGKGKQTINIATENFNNGVYFMRINGGAAKKLIIQH